MERREPRAVLRMNDTVGAKGYYAFINISDPIIWGQKGAPAPDADCLDGDMIMCMLADQGIQGMISHVAYGRLYAAA